ncbi:MAG: exodeoxyribonuclease III [Planctomycetaceae bacterium]
MRITTWNVNGLRAALRKGFADVIEQIAPDILLLQEVRALPEQLPDAWAAPEGWHVCWHPAQRKGYSGTAIWSRKPLQVMDRGMGGPDPEGRVLRVRVERMELVSVYAPSGSSGPDRQSAKDRWMARFLPWARSIATRRKRILIGGDLNVAHTERDIFYAASNKQQSGFLPHEREWFSALLQAGWADLIREQVPDVDGPYSWWSNRGRARELDRGWRIDYLLGNGTARRACVAAEVHRELSLSVSDHAPVTVDLA